MPWLRELNSRTAKSLYIKNYSRYYGYRCKEKFKDNRMNYFNRDWFKGKFDSIYVSLFCKLWIGRKSFELFRKTSCIIISGVITVQL